MDRQTVETALDGGCLWAKMTSGRYWRARRNGKTQLWKRSPDRFRIPFKIGLKECGQLTEDTNPEHFLILPYGEEPPQNKRT